MAVVQQGSGVAFVSSGGGAIGSLIRSRQGQQPLLNVQQMSLPTAALQAVQGSVDEVNPNLRTTAGASFALISSVAAGVAAGATYPFNAALSTSIADQMRLPTASDIRFNAMHTAGGRAVLQSALVEFLRLPMVSLGEKGCKALGLGPDRARLSGQIVALLATNLMICVMTSPIETLALQQHHSGKPLLTLGKEMLSQNPAGLFTSMGSSFVSMNISWALRLYAREKAGGDNALEEKISARLTSILSPAKNFLRCVNARQMLHNELLGVAIAGTLRAMAKQPVNTLVLIALNILIAARLGGRIYFGVRNTLSESLSKQTSMN